MNTLDYFKNRLDLIADEDYLQMKEMMNKIYPLNIGFREFFLREFPEPSEKNGIYITPDGEIVEPSVLPISLSDEGKKKRYFNQRRNHWINRLAVESYGRKGVYFVTLTYNSDLVETEAKISHLQLFMKRLRSYMVKHKIQTADGLPLKYFFTAEQGEKYGRLHYHGVIFGLPLKVRNLLCNPKLNKDGTLKKRLDGRIFNIWTYGFVSASPITARRILYVVKYMYKCPLLPRPFKSDGIGVNVDGTEKKHNLRNFLIQSKQPYFHIDNLKFYVNKKTMVSLWPDEVGEYLAEVKIPIKNRRFSFSYDGRSVHSGRTDYKSVSIRRFGSLKRDDIKEYFNREIPVNSFVAPFSDTYMISCENLDGFTEVIPIPSDYYDYIYHLNNSDL